MAHIRKKRLDGGRVSWQAIIKRSWLDKPIRKGGFALKGEAAEWARKKEVELDARRKADTYDMTIGQVAEYFIEHGTLEMKPSWKKIVVTWLRWWVEELQDRKMSEIGIDAVRGGIAKLRVTPHRFGDGMSQNTIHKYAITLKQAVGFVVSDGVLDRHAICNWKIPPIGGPRKRVLTRGPGGELERLTAAIWAADHWIGDLFMLALASGARQRELLLVRRRDVDLEGRIVRLEHTKNDKPRPVPVLGFAAGNLQRVCERKQGRDYIFPHKIGKSPRFPVATWQRARAEAGIVDFTWHDLRHCFATYLLEDHQEVTLFDIKEILGHAEYRTTESVYVNLRPESHISKVAALSADFGAS